MSIKYPDCNCAELDLSHPEPTTEIFHGPFCQFAILCDHCCIQINHSLKEPHKYYCPFAKKCEHCKGRIDTKRPFHYTECPLL